MFVIILPHIKKILNSRTEIIDQITYIYLQPIHQNYYTPINNKLMIKQFNDKYYDHENY